MLKDDLSNVNCPNCRMDNVSVYALVQLPLDGSKKYDVTIRKFYCHDCILTFENYK